VAFPEGGQVRRIRRRNRRHAFTPYVPRKDLVTYGTADLGHVVLLGDSILDNEHYTMGAPDVSQRLHGMLGDDWAVSLAARDGAVTETLKYQLPHIPLDATHLVVSIGGNNAMGETGMLTDPREMTMRDAMSELSLMGEVFGISYEEAMTPLLSLGVPVTACTIYDCDFEDSAVALGIAVFNDVILRFALAHDLGILDLRAVCTLPSDYELTIEPSATGGAKIAAAVRGHLPYRSATTLS
jgi:hypothetical protein